MDLLGLIGLRKIKPRDFVLHYEKLQERKLPNSRRVEELRFLVMDTETTGVNPRSDFILSYGAVEVHGMTIPVQTTKEYYLKTKRLGREAIKVHEIVNPFQSISRERLIREFLEDAAGKILVGHHLGFDLAMMKKAGRSFGLRKINNPCLDTMDLAIRLDMGRQYDPKMVNYKNYSLDKLCGHYRISLDDRHTAAGDAFLTAQLLVKLLKKAHKSGIVTYADLFG
jgi:DNA polymerase III subunit epsilon